MQMVFSLGYKITQYESPSDIFVEFCFVNWVIKYLSVSPLT